MPGQVAPIVLAHAYKAVPQIPSSKLISVHNLKGQLLAAIEFSNTTAATLETEYTHSVRHFLLIGTLAMFLGAIVFGFMAIKSNHKITETLTFIIAVIATGSYYMMYNGYGVAHKETGDGQVTLIFFSRYVDWLLTTPLLLLDIALLVNANAAEITMLLGNDIIMILAGAIGSTLLNPYKWFWWVVGMIFFALVFIQVFGFLTKIKDDDSAFVQGIRVLIILTFVSWCVYPILWILGSEGLHTLSLELEVGLVCLADVVAKIGFGFYLLFAVIDSKPGQQAESTETERTSLV